LISCSVLILIKNCLILILSSKIRFSRLMEQHLMRSKQSITKSATIAGTKMNSLISSSCSTFMVKSGLKSVQVSTRNVLRNIVELMVRNTFSLWISSLLALKNTWTNIIKVRIKKCKVNPLINKALRVTPWNRRARKIYVQALSNWQNSSGNTRIYVQNCLICIEKMILNLIEACFLNTWCNNHLQIKKIKVARRITRLVNSINALICQTKPNNWALIVLIVSIFHRLRIFKKLLPMNFNYMKKYRNS